MTTAALPEHVRRWRDEHPKTHAMAGPIVGSPAREDDDPDEWLERRRAASAEALFADGDA